MGTHSIFAFRSLKMACSRSSCFLLSEQMNISKPAAFQSCKDRISKSKFLLKEGCGLAEKESCLPADSIEGMAAKLGASWVSCKG